MFDTKEDEITRAVGAADMIVDLPPRCFDDNEQWIKVITNFFCNNNCDFRHRFSGLDCCILH